MKGKEKRKKKEMKPSEKLSVEIRKRTALPIKEMMKNKH